MLPNECISVCVMVHFKISSHVFGHAGVIRDTGRELSCRMKGHLALQAIVEGEGSMQSIGQTLPWVSFWKCSSACLYCCLYSEAFHQTKV